MSWVACRAGLVWLACHKLLVFHAHSPLHSLLHAELARHTDSTRPLVFGCKVGFSGYHAPAVTHQLSRTWGYVAGSCGIQMSGSWAWPGECGGVGSGP